MPKILPTHFAADGLASRLRLGALTDIEAPAPWRVLRVAVPLSLALCVLAGMVLDRGTRFWTYFGMTAAVLGPVVAIYAGMAFWRARDGFQVRIHEHGLVVVTGDRVLGGRWRQLRLTRVPVDRHTDRVTLMTPMGPVNSLDDWVSKAYTLALIKRRTEIPDAREAVILGDEWDFSGWFVSREGVRTPSTRGRWGQLTVRLVPTRMTSPAMLELVDGTGTVRDSMFTDDAENLLHILDGIVPHAIGR